MPPRHHHFHHSFLHLLHLFHRRSAHAHVALLFGIILGLRQLKLYSRSRARIIGALGQPTLFLLALGFGLGPTFARAGRGDYVQFLAPGIVTSRSFSDPHREHLATRRAGGLFDFSFMSCTEIEGPEALSFVNAMQTRRLDALRPGRIAYTLLMREIGSILNDATVWCFARDCFWVFTGRAADAYYLAQIGTGFNVKIAHRGPRQAVIAVQGDISRSTIEACRPEPGSGNSNARPSMSTYRSPSSSR